MPKFARPNSYNGKQSNQNWTGSVRAANASEAAAGDSSQLYISPLTLASAVGTLLPDATTTSKGKVELATLAELQTGTAPVGAWVPTANDVATVIASIVVGVVPPATITQQGIVELATDTQVVSPFTTDVSNTAVQPSNITAMFASPPPLGATVPAAATVTDFTATGTISVASAAPITIDVTGAGNDLTLSSDAGRVIVNGEEAAANAVTIFSAAGGLDVDVALQMNLASSQNAASAIVISASAGGIDLTAAGAAGEDIDLVCTSGSINLTAGESAADSIVITSSAGGIDILANGAAAGEDIDISTSASVNITSTENNGGAVIVRANGGTSERVTLLSSQGTGADSINLESTAGGITLSAAVASADAINLAASAGGVDIDGALQVNIASSQNAVDAIRIVASAGGIDIDAVGAATEDINLTNTGGSVVVVATESAADAIRMNASGVAGGFDLDSGTGGFIVDTTGAVSLDSAAASNFTVTGAFDLSLISSLGSVNITAGEDAADAIVLSAGAGGIDILATGAAGQDIDIINTGGSVNVTATENVSNAIVINASGAASGISIDCGTVGLTIGTGMNVAVTAVVTGVDASPYALLGTDYFVSVDTGAGVMTITLPAAPATGRKVTIYDGGGAAAGSNITIDGNGKNIAAGGSAAGTKLINTAYESYNLVYNGTLWLGQNIV